jgi:hypothetical protein
MIVRTDVELLAMLLLIWRKHQAAGGVICAARSCNGGGLHSRTQS